MKINGEDLLELGYPEGKVMGIALAAIGKNFAEQEKEEVLALMLKLFQYPENFLDDKILSPVAKELVIKAKAGMRRSH